MIIIDKEKCNDCNRCYEICPENIINKGPSIIEKTNLLCSCCGHCVAICPEDAVMLLSFEDIDVKPLPSEKPVGAENMMSLLKGRRSIRKYTDKPVSKADLEKILQAASLAPSGHNWRSVKAYVYTDEKVIKNIHDSIMRIYRLLSVGLPFPGVDAMFKLMGHDTHEFRTIEYGVQNVLLSKSKGDRLFFNTNTLIAFTASRNDSFGTGDAWIAAQNAVNYAETIGVGSCYQGYATLVANWDPLTRSVFRIPMMEKIVALLTFGYPDIKFEREAPRKPIPTTWI